MRRIGAIETGDGEHAGDRRRRADDQAQLEAWWGIGATHREGPLWAQSLLYGATAALLVFRRVRPLTVLAVMVAVYVVAFALFGAPEGNGVARA